MVDAATHAHALSLVYIQRVGLHREVLLNLDLPTQQALDGRPHGGKGLLQLGQRLADDRHLRRQRGRDNVEL